MVHTFVVESTIIPKAKVMNIYCGILKLYTMNYDWKFINFTNEYECKFNAIIRSLTKNKNNIRKYIELIRHEYMKYP